MKLRFMLPAVALAGLAFGVGCGSGSDAIVGLPEGGVTVEQITRGRSLVIGMGCADCHHGGVINPSLATWLSGYRAGTPGQPFNIGPFTTYPANLTPDATGIGGYSERQIFNALRHGLSPRYTSSAVITDANFPAAPHYLAPPMPWPAYRHLSDADTWAIVAYLKHGLKPVNNDVPDSQFPPDKWASSYVDGAVGPKVIPPFPAAGEVVTP